MVRVLFNRLLFVFQGLFGDERVVVENFVCFKFIFDVGGVCGGEKLESEVFDNFIEGLMFFLHFLMMTSALFCFPRANEFGHGFEDFIHASELFHDEMFAVSLQEPMIFFVFFLEPMTLV